MNTDYQDEPSLTNREFLTAVDALEAIWRGDLVRFKTLMNREPGSRPIPLVVALLARQATTVFNAHFAGLSKNPSAEEKQNALDLMMSDKAFLVSTIYTETLIEIARNFPTESQTEVMIRSIIGYLLTLVEGDKDDVPELLRLLRNGAWT